VARGLRNRRAMKTWLLLMAIGGTALGCATTTVAGPAANIQARPWVTETASAQVTAETDGGADQPTVVVEAASPTSVRYRTEGETVVPLQHFHPPAPTKRRIRTHQGMWIGAAIGVLAGVSMGAANERSASADPDCPGGSCVAGPILAGGILGAIGLGLGAAVGAIVGTIEGP